MGNYNSENMLEKHYTPETLYNYMADEILDKFHQVEITEFIENSAGDGRLIDFLKQRYNVDVIAYDKFNETLRADIKECDYLKEKIEYKKGRVAFINPPFNKGLKFVYKALEESDYVVSVLGVTSWLNIDYDKYEVDCIDIFRKYDFGSCKAAICVIGIKKK